MGIGIIIGIIDIILCVSILYYCYWLWSCCNGQLIRGATTYNQYKQYNTK